jgi:hypothetical protein
MFKDAQRDEHLLDSAAGLLVEKSSIFPVMHIIGSIE